MTIEDFVRPKRKAKIGQNKICTRLVENWSFEEEIIINPSKVIQQKKGRVFLQIIAEEEPED